MDAGTEHDSGTDASSGADATLPPETLTVTTEGWGVVTASPSSSPDLSCPTTCSTTYTQGTHVTLTATPSAGQTFTGWSGGTGSASTCTGTGACDIVIDGASTVHAAFTATYPTSTTPVNETYSCTVSVPLGSVNQTNDLTVTMAGAPPTHVPPGTGFTMELFQAVAQVPAAVSTTAASDNCTSISGQVTTFQISSTDAHNTGVDPASGSPSSFAFGPIAITSGVGFDISLPATPATIGSFTAGSSGTIDFSPSTATASLFANLSFTCDGISGIPGTLSCTAVSPTPFATTTVP